MKLLIDENIPARVIRHLKTIGIDTERVTPGTSDTVNVARSERENRCLLSLDKDLLNTHIFPPNRFNILLIDIHPPHADALIRAIDNLLKMLPRDKWRGLVILKDNGFIRTLE